MPEPYNYGAQLGQIDIPGAFARGLQVRQLQEEVNAAPERRALEADKIRVLVEAKRAELEKERVYQADLGALLQEPSGEGYRAFMLRHPDQYEATKAGWEAYNEDQQKALLGTASGVYAAISNGQTDLAKELLKTRKTALQSQGVPTDETDAILSLVESGDEGKLKQAKGLAGYALAAAVGPEKIGSILERLDGGEAKVLGYGDRLVSPDGQVLFSAPDAPFTLGEGAARYSGTGGGGQSVSGDQIESTILSAIPGAVVTSRKRSPERNRIVGGVANSYHLTGQARDFVPPQGVGMSEFASQVRLALPGMDVLNEGDHVHVEPRKGSGVVAARPKEKDVKPSETRVVRGKAYYKVDGRWFDNPEGR